MENEKIKVEVISERKLKALRLKAKIREMAQAGWEWCKDNKEMLVIFGTGATALVNGVTKLKRSHREDEKKHIYYDPHTGAHWQLKRELTNAERAELMRRQRDGEYTEYILADMGVLK